MREGGKVRKNPGVEQDSVVRRQVRLQGLKVQWKD